MLPRLADDIESRVCIVIDVLRASTTLCCLMEAGAQQVIIADSPPAARQIAKALGKETLLCGEWDGFKPPDFDHGNSPGPYLDAALTGQQIVFCSSNGAKALHHV